MKTPASALMDFLLNLDALKAVERRTLPSGLARLENSAEHSWHVALSALLFARECAFAVDASHAALLLLMHDVPEIGCGDTFAYSADAEAASMRERAALEVLLAPLAPRDASGLRALWEEFAANATPEARYANALDRLLPVLHNLSHDGLSWRQHGVRLEQVIARVGCVGEVLPGVWALLRPRLEAHFAGVTHAH
ncbi:MAG: HD domain-containing protein [Candidatus Dactylopiibacterium sp.]|nr:HD domain-containing protein [Candidatus Dactylopiibacterium sp.]